MTPITTLGQYHGLLYKLERDRHKLANREERTKVLLRSAVFLLLVGCAIYRIFFL